VIHAAGAAAQPIPSLTELEAAGAVIGEIVVDTSNIFDLDDPNENSFPYRAANALHVKTRPSLIRRLLLFRSGERVSVRVIEETERLIRNNSSVYEVAITPTAYRDGVVKIVDFGLASMGHALAVCGRAEDGVRMVQRAMRLNPHHPEWYWSMLAIGFYSARRYEEALEAYRRIAVWKKPWHLARLAACYAQLGRLDEARAQAAEVLRLDPEFRLSNVKLFYRNPADAEISFEGMRKAGFPE